MKKFSIRIKLIILFVVIKLIPLAIISYIAIFGAKELSKHFEENTESLFAKSNKLIESTATEAIDGSIKALDKTAQNSLERLSYELAQTVAAFLYERDKDLLFLSKLDMNDDVLKNFYDSKYAKIVADEEYIFDKTTQTWKIKREVGKIERENQTANLKDNQKEFSYTDLVDIKYKSIPIYKEVTYLDLNGNEIYKISQINPKKQNISNKSNTYCNSETYFSKLSKLKNGEIYVSEVIGEYVPTKVIGTFNEENAKKANIPFEPQKYANAGAENPVGKKFEAIVRFVTPVFKNGVKIGFVTIALDHTHLMNFTDSFSPTSKDPRQVLSDGNQGNYAFMWDKEARCISHPRDYFIVGFSKKTGQRVPGWLSVDVAEKFKNSNQKDLNKFLENYPKFEEQSLTKKPNIAQLKELGQVGLDCRYLNFAPQCEGWMQLTQNGGYGSFIIFWSKVWKLTTAATIPYYTGDYSRSKRGFGFVTIGANVDEFHAAANETKQKVNLILKEQSIKAKESLNENNSEIQEFVSSIINELTIVTLLMIMLVIFIAMWMSSYIVGKISNLINATHKFSNGNFDYKINSTSLDEIGELEKSFDNMASKIETLLRDQKDLNEHLEEKVLEKTAQLQKINLDLQAIVANELAQNRQKESLLIQQSKMATLGEMMSSIVHQWMQPLNAINFLASSMVFKAEIQEVSKEEIIENSNNITKQIEHMSQTMHDFKNFFKPTQAKQFEVNELCKNAINLVKGIFNIKGIELQYTGCAEVYSSGYPNELIQVLINLFNNARDIILEKSIDSKVIMINSTIENDDILITVKDLAGGIPEEILDKVFEPYFTTKGDNGTGIGLYMSKAIAQKSSGDLSVENYTTTENQLECKGAKFTLTIKRVR